MVQITDNSCDKSLSLSNNHDVTLSWRGQRQRPRAVTRRTETTARSRPNRIVYALSYRERTISCQPSGPP